MDSVKEPIRHRDNKYRAPVEWGVVLAASSPYAKDTVNDELPYDTHSHGVRRAMVEEIHSEGDLL